MTNNEGRPVMLTWIGIVAVIILVAVFILLRRKR
ncbi:MAG TPA: LPXTG cell wall anchor domain-containing protein [Dehalococcoidales bacterium]|nr:LPXTG cell wall anchor domain-containing protein [Dehalococcoidales bacterium]